MILDLRGHRPPEESILQRLYDLSPHYRLAWFPASPGIIVDGRLHGARPALWELYEIRPQNPSDQARRVAGEARLARMSRWPEDRKRKHQWDFEYSRQMMRGLWTVGQFPDITIIVPGASGTPTVVPAFGSDRFFLELRESELSFREELLALDRAAQNEATDEFDENPEFRAKVIDQYRQGAIEDWALIFRDRRHIQTLGLKPPKERDHAGTDREQMARPGHGEARESA
jgi:hypothetical protein